MTDRTQPEALRLAAWLNEGAWHQMRLGDVEAAGRELRRQHTRIAELESELEAVGAGGVSGPLIGRAALAASPTAEQQIQPGAVGRTGCTAGTDEECTRRGCATSCPAQQAAPKAAPGESLTRDQIREVFMAHGFTVKEGHTDLKQYVYDAAYALLAMGSAPKAAPGEPGWWRKRADEIEVQVALTGSPEAMRCYTDMRTLLQAATEAAPQQEAQEPCPTCAALARTVMLDQVSFDRKPDCYGIRQITDDEGVEEWEDIRTSPDVAREEANDMMATGRGEIYEVVPLWTTPQLAPDCHHRPPCDECAALAAQGGKDA